MRFDDVDLGNCLSQMFGLHKLDGRGTLALDVDGSGQSVWAVTHTLNGSASLGAQDGALIGIDVAQLLQRLEKRPLSGNGDFRNGRTQFDRLMLTVKIDHGTISVQKLEFNGPAVKLRLAGEASIPSRDLDLQGTPTLVSANTADEVPALSFTVQGPWDSPVPLPDASSLIRHSNAAAPLLEAVKRHSAGDAVRSVIDQLFAPPAAQPATASKPATATSPAAPEYKPAAVTAPATSQ